MSKNLSPRWKAGQAGYEQMERERKSELKVYSGSVHVTIRARDKREARKALESVGSLSRDVEVVSTAGPELDDDGGEP